MLSPEEKAKIKAEELYRAQVKANLTKKKPSKNLNGLQIFLVLLIGFIVISAISRGRNINPSNQPTKDTYSTFDFATQCEKLVKNKLKAPATAKFADYATQQKEIKQNKSGYTWVGWVDAENTFSALIRTAFLCEYTHKTKSVSVNLFPTR